MVVGNGETQREFHVYKSLLEHHSSYFRTALKPTWKEGATRVVKLPEDDPDIFAIFFHWIFTGKLYPKLTAKGKVPLSFLEAFRVYVFSDARGIPALGNASINLIFQKSFQDWKCPTDHLQYVYENTLPGSRLREFIVDDALECYNFTKLAEEPELFTKDFLVEVFRSKMRGLCPGRPSLLDRATYIKEKKDELCKYHIHVGNK